MTRAQLALGPHYSLAKFQRTNCFCASADKLSFSGLGGVL